MDSLSIAVEGARLIIDHQLTAVPESKYNHFDIEWDAIPDNWTNRAEREQNGVRLVWYVEVKPPPIVSIVS